MVFLGKKGWDAAAWGKKSSIWKHFAKGGEEDSSKKEGKSWKLGSALGENFLYDAVRWEHIKLSNLMLCIILFSVYKQDNLFCA
ncbi:hypothetical protein V6Z12_A11G362600 [Gossypium hirsutum]